MRAFAINQGMSARYERPMREVIKLRAARAQQVARQQALAMAEQASKAAKNLGSAPQSMQDQVGEQVADAGGGNVVPIGAAA